MSGPAARPPAQSGRTRDAWTPTEYQAHVDRSISEAAFQAQVMQLARVLGWKAYHTHDSRRSDPGFPDLVLVHPQHGVLFRELKTERGRVSDAQRTWLAALAASGADAAVWRPHDKSSGLVEFELRGGHTDHGAPVDVGPHTP